MKRTVGALITAAALLTAAVASGHGIGARFSTHQRPPRVRLITPAGRPVSGRWQRWVDESKAPTLLGALVFYSSSSVCGGVAACSGGSPWYRFSGSPFTAVGPDPGARRDDLYFELGHQFDWHVLTWPERRHLARGWGLPRWHWEDSSRSINLGGEDGLEAYFAAIYADCSEGVSDDNGAEVALQEPWGVKEPPPITPAIDTCAYLWKIASRP